MTTIFVLAFLVSAEPFPTWQFRGAFNTLERYERVVEELKKDPKLNGKVACLKLGELPYEIQRRLQVQI